MAARRWLLTLGVVVGAVGWAQEAPRLSPLPLELTPSSGLMKHQAALRRVFEETLGSQVGVVAPSRREVEAAVNAIGPADFAQSDEAVARAARASGTLYALCVTTGIDGSGAMVVTGRVIREDGKRMTVQTAKVARLRGKEKLVDKARQAFLQLFGALQLHQLPAFMEAPAPEKLSSAAPVLEPVGPPPGMPRPVEAGVADMSAAPGFPIGRVGYAAVGVGAAVAIVGLVLFAAAPVIHTDGYGYVLSEDVARVRASQTQQGVGVGLLACGGALAALGASAAIWAHNRGATASLLLTAGGGALVLGGKF